MTDTSGHRQRMKSRFKAEGLDNFDERHVLEMLLYYCVPRQDTRELSLRLLKHFGSFAQVLDATPEELERVPGVGEGISTFLQFRKAVERYYRICKEKTDEPISSVEQYGSILSSRFQGERNEVVYILCLDAKCKVVSCMFVGEGSVNSANVPIRRVVEMCLAANATSAVLAHNHPSGLAMPSEEDVATTFRLAKALDAVDVALIDHLIFTDGDYVSLLQSNYYRYKPT